MLVVGGDEEDEGERLWIWKIFMERFELRIFKEVYFR